MALFRYPGKKTWWYEFHFAGQKVRESAKTKSKTLARRAEQKRRRDGGRELPQTQKEGCTEAVQCQCRPN